MTDEEIRARMRSMLADERDTKPLTWWWLSFADGTRPKGSQFLGAVLVRAHGTTDAVLQSHRLGLNPGGEVLSVQAPDGYEPNEKYVGRLLSKADIAEMDARS
jgi:hypothetical protein